MSGNRLADEAQSTLISACERFGLDPQGAILLRVRSNVVYKLGAPIVVRIAFSADDTARMRSVLAVTRWLATHGFPTVRPFEEIREQPILHEGKTVTFWDYVPTGEPKPTTGELGELLQDLHTRPVPQVPLPMLTDPLRSIRETVRHQPGVLTENERSWLCHRITELTEQWYNLDFAFPPALLHGDPWIDNLWRHANGSVVLGDWDHVAVGPREWDLIHTYHGQRRWGLTLNDVDAFIHSYGYDLRDWPGYTALMDIRDLYAVGIHIRNAPYDPFSRRELIRRLQSLLSNDQSRRWYLAAAGDDGR